MNHITYIARFLSPFPRWRQTNENKIIFIYFVNIFRVFTTGFDLFTDYRHEAGHINVLPDPEPFIGKCLGIRHCRTPRPWVSRSGTAPRDTSFIFLVTYLFVSITYLLLENDEFISHIKVSTLWNFTMSSIDHEVINLKNLQKIVNSLP